MKTILSLTLILLIGCNFTGEKAQQQPKKQSFRTVSVPLTINSPEARAEYLATHYWDNFDFTDTSYVDNPDVTEQAFTNYIAILQNIEQKQADLSINALLDHAQQDSSMFAYFNELSEKYLYDPNSPMRSEELYIPVLRYLIGSPKVTEIMKVRPKALLEMALKNRPGQKATNFDYTTTKGVSSNLYALKNEYVILFFNNPGCNACREITEQIMASALLTEMLNNKTLCILAIYPDQDLDEWRKYAPHIPQTWINAYDRSHKIADNQLYDLKAIPTLYLLSKDKTVLLKDAPFENIEQMLRYRTGADR